MQPRCFHPTSFVILNEIALIRLLQIPFFLNEECNKSKEFYNEVEARLFNKYRTSNFRSGRNLCN